MTAWKMIVIGTSKGGFSALRALLTALPGDFPLPVAVVQHRGAETDSRLREALQEHSPLPVVEVEDKEEILGGRVYLAPANYHLLVDNGRFSLSTDDPVSYARPSIDVLFESAADACGAGVITVVLTGANRDGAAGAAAVKRRGGLVVVQDPATAEQPAMPEAAIAALRDWRHDRNSQEFRIMPPVDQSAIHNPKSEMANGFLQILPLEDIGPFIVRTVKNKKGGNVLS